MIEQIGCILGCGRARRNRGLCQSHYKSSCDAVRAGKTTWDKLIAAGEALPARDTKKFHKPALFGAYGVKPNEGDY